MAEKMTCQIPYAAYKLKSIHDFIDSLPRTLNPWALARKVSAASEEDLSQLSPLQPLENEAQEAPSQARSTTPVRSPSKPKPMKAMPRARRAAVVTTKNLESIEDAKKKAKESRLVVSTTESMLYIAIILLYCFRP